MIFDWTPIISTERLILREQNENVIYNVFEKLNTHEQLLFFGLDNTGELKKEREKYSRVFTINNVNFKKWNILKKDQFEIIGECGFHTWKIDHQVAEIGYKIYKQTERKKRYMSEAFQRIIEYGFKNMNLNRIEALISPDNIPSLQLVVKNGFTKEGVLREHFKINNKIHDSVVYSLLKREYEF